MKKWMMTAAANWLRKPENQQKAKSAWNKFRNRNASQHTSQSTSRNTAQQRPDDADRQP